MDVLNRAVRKDNSIVNSIGTFLNCRGLEPLLHSVVIFGVNSLKKGFIYAGTCLGWIETKDTISLLRPEELSRGHVQGPTARVAQPLPCCQVGFATPQRFFRPLALGDVFHNGHAKPGRRFGAWGQRNSVSHPDQLALLVTVALLLAELLPFTLPELGGENVVGRTVLLVRNVQV